ncbi:MAG: DUF4271 domain-containing protein [Lewinella sp.]|nr:DUF4271 domain-containing protein [Lewinella sp.]
MTNSIVFRRLLIWTVLLLPLAGILSAQSAGNPFEIKPRLGQMPESTGPAAADMPTGNPFDIVSPDAEALPEASFETPTHGMEGPDVIQPPPPLDGFIMALLLFSFILLAILVTLYRPYFAKVFQSISNDNMLSQTYREYERGQVIPYLALYSMFFINAGILLFLLVKRVFQVPLNYSNGLLLLGCVGAVILAFLLKHFLLSFISSIFPVEKEVKLYNFTIMIFSIFLGIGFMAGNVALGLASEGLLSYLMIGLGVFVGLVYLLRSFRGLLIGSRFIPLYIFHFLLYICTVEFAPVALVAKLIMNQL